MKYVTKQIITWGSDSTCLGAIQECQSPYLPVWNILSVISVNMDLIGYHTSFSSAHLLLWFRNFLISSRWPTLFHPPSNWSIQWPLTLLICLTLRCELLRTSVSPLNLSHILMDGTELDYKWYIWIQGCQTPQFCSANRITNEGTTLELFQAISRFEPILKEAHQELKMICKVRSLQSRLRDLNFWKRL